MLTVGNVDTSVLGLVQSATGVPVRLSVGLQADTQLGPVQSSYSIKQPIAPGSKVFTALPGQFVEPGQATAVVANRGGYATAVTLTSTPTSGSQNCGRH